MLLWPWPEHLTCCTVVIGNCSNRRLPSGRKVMIGVTTDEFARSLHKPHKFDPYLERKKQLERLLSDGAYSPEPKLFPSSIVSVQRYVIGIFRLWW